MRKIPVIYWKAKIQDSDDEIEECIMDVLITLINNKKPEEMPKGLDNFRLMTRLTQAFDKAKETKELILEEADYNFIKNTIEREIPSVWGANPNIISAIDSFLNTISL